MSDLSNDQIHNFVLADVSQERERQDERWGVQDYRSVCSSPTEAKSYEGLAKMLCEWAKKDGTLTWEHIAMEEMAESIAAKDDRDRRVELVQLAAVVVAWIECIDRRGA